MVYKKLLGHRPSFSDLLEAQPSLARGLSQLLEFEGDVENTFCRSVGKGKEAMGEGNRTKRGWAGREEMEGMGRGGRVESVKGEEGVNAFLAVSEEGLTTTLGGLCHVHIACHQPSCCRTFEVEYEFYGSTRKQELMPGGADTPVTADNRGQASVGKGVEVHGPSGRTCTSGGMREVRDCALGHE